MKHHPNIVIWAFLSLNYSAYSEVLPPEAQQKIIKTVSGPIKHCDFMELGTWGFQVFVGIQLENSDAPYIRFNIAHTERDPYDKWCKDKSDVKIRYRIKRTKKKFDTTYWAEDIEENKNNSTK